MQGVYAQMTSTPDASNPYNYIQAVDCSDLFPDLDESISASLQGYSCPNIADYSLQGNLGQPNQNSVSQFLYIVNSCEAMAPLRATFGQSPVTCAAYEDTLAVLDRIEVSVQMTNEFFNPNEYVKDTMLPLQVTFQ